MREFLVFTVALILVLLIGGALVWLVVLQPPWEWDMEGRAVLVVAAVIIAGGVAAEDASNRKDTD